MISDINRKLVETYIDKNIILTRFTTFEDLKNKVNERVENYGYKVKDYSFKTDFDNDFEDFKVMMTLGNDEEDLIDLDLWFAITRIGERIVVESNFEEVI